MAAKVVTSWTTKGKIRISLKLEFFLTGNANAKNMLKQRYTINLFIV